MEDTSEIILLATLLSQNVVTDEISEAMIQEGETLMNEDRFLNSVEAVKAVAAGLVNDCYGILVEVEPGKYKLGIPSRHVFWGKEF
jgi:hypothetical protein